MSDMTIRFEEDKTMVVRSEDGTINRFAANRVEEPGLFERRIARVNWRRLDRQATACCTGFLVLCSGMISYWIIKAIVLCIYRAVR